MRAALLALLLTAGCLGMGEGVEITVDNFDQGQHEVRVVAVLHPGDVRRHADGSIDWTAGELLLVRSVEVAPGKARAAGWITARHAGMLLVNATVDDAHATHASAPMGAAARVDVIVQPGGRPSIRIV
jgi:hypothetical protein